MTDHRCFTVATTNYLRNLDREDLNGRCVAVHYQKPPKKTEQGTSFGLRIPALIVTDYLVDPDVVAQRVADILERHWDDEPVVRLDDAARFPDQPLPDSQLQNGGACS
ncbi:MAG: hypothetical protein H6916_04105 [Novosphingobium sp.]|uniref:hypothetical protein n=1 Tax=Novosphingobium sp. TaxID=1874826 RepID=UPI00262F5BAF|nr:hypothetical protein [Novosphingobium sp.]MCP5385985.1 hypothetical protein [Novosphingobium sp.]